MKIAIPSSGTNLSAPLDARFGRAKYFLIYDSDSEETSVIENTQNISAPQGAGIQAAQTVAQAGVNVLLAGNVGPKAFDVLRQAGIKVFLAQTESASQALDDYRNQKLKQTDQANVVGHW